MSSNFASEAGTSRKVYLLRHSIVASHRGDVPLTDDGVILAKEVGRHLARSEKRLRFLYGSTLRARQTAEAIAEGARTAGAETEEPHHAFALRNPDIYVAGERVNMVSSFEAVAAQVHGMTAKEAEAVPFFRGFIGARDRVGWWLRQEDPPGENRAAVARRIIQFAASLADGSAAAATTVAITHSPILRACALELLGEDPGEPEWVAGLLVEIDANRDVRMAPLAGAP